MNHNDFATAFRAFTLLLLAVAAGMMTRFYLTRPTMKLGAFAAFALFIAGAIWVTIGNFVQPWEWGESPVFCAAAAVTIIGVTRHLRWKS